MKLKDRGITDPDLGTGLAYMVNDMNYAAHLKETAGISSNTPVSTYVCVVLRPRLPPLTRQQLVALIFMLSIKCIPGI